MRHPAKTGTPIGSDTVTEVDVDRRELVSSVVFQIEGAALLGKQGDAQWKKLARPAPAEPLAFFEGHQYGEKRYTNGADRDKIVAPKCAPWPHPSASCVPLRETRATLRCPVCRFRETTFELLGGVKELNFNKLNFGDDEAVQLAVVLPLCAKLTELQLTDTQLGAQCAERGLDGGGGRNPNPNPDP